MLTVAPTAPSRARQLRPLLVALGAAIVYGSWAMHANQVGGSAVALRAALVQGATSFTATLLMASVQEKLFRVPRSPARGFALACSAALALGVGTVTLGHLLAGTPRILVTIAPSIAVGTTFNVVYALGLLRAARASAAG